jgi:O-succinylbenzoic acid--CoA ligase
MATSSADLTSDKSIILFNPRLPEREKKNLLSLIERFRLPRHIFVATSGSTAIDSKDIKWVALKKEAFFASAESVNHQLNTTAKDIFLNILPSYHVGGFSLQVRANCLNAKYYDSYDEEKKWDPQTFVKQINLTKSTITSLVPTQVFDLVQQQIQCPETLRMVVVGGGFLNQHLYEQAQKLKWPLLPSYGMTECCSQVATALPGFSWQGSFPKLNILSHLKVTIAKTGQIKISGDSLLTGYLFQEGGKVRFHDPKQEGSILTHDLGEVKNNHLIVFGRDDENIKINGENVSLIRIQSLLEKEMNPNWELAVVSIPEPRSGFKLIAVFDEKYESQRNGIEGLIAQFNTKVNPFERINHFYFINCIPKTDLGKVKRKQIVNNLIQDKKLTV